MRKENLTNPVVMSIGGADHVTWMEVLDVAVALTSLANGKVGDVMSC